MKESIKSSYGTSKPMQVLQPLILSSRVMVPDLRNIFYKDSRESRTLF
jgi:hypothetical protein